MMEIKFNYKNKSQIIKCNLTDLIKDVCENFANKNSLDIDNLLFVNEGKTINLNSGFYVEQQFKFFSDKKQKKLRKAELLVIQKARFLVTFTEATETFPLEVNENDKMKNIFERYALLKKKDLNKILFLYNGTQYSYKDIGERTVIEISNELDKKENIMSIMIIELTEEDSYKSNIIALEGENNNDNYNNDDNNCQNDNNNEVNSNSINNIDEHIKDNELEQSLSIEKNETLDPFFYSQKWYYIKICIILIIQYILIILFSFLIFYFQINISKIIMDIDKYFIAFQAILFMSLVSFFYIKCLFEKRNKWYMLTFNLIYSLIIFYYVCLLSKYIHYKYIIIGLVIILIEIFTLFINAIFFKKFRLLYFSISSFALNIVGLTLLFLFGIKDLFPMIYISIFCLVTIGYYILWVFVSLKICESKEYYFSTLIFNYGIVLGLAWIIAKGLNYIIDLILKRIKNENLEEMQFIPFCILLGQNIIIFIVVWIGFHLGWNEYLKNDSKYFNWFISINIIMNFILSFFQAIFYDNYEDHIIWYIFHIMYIPMMIIYYNLFSCLLDEKFILCFIFIIVLDMMFSSLGIFIFLKDSYCILFFYCIISNLATIIPLYYFWIKNYEFIIYISIAAFIVDIYIMVIAYITQKKQTQFTYIFSVIAYDYTFFTIIFLLSVGFIISLFYLIYLLLKSLLC